MAPFGGSQMRRSTAKARAILVATALAGLLQACGPSGPTVVGTLKKDSEIIHGPAWGDRELDIGDRKVKVRARVWEAGEAIPADQLPVFDENGDGRLDAGDPTFGHSVGVKTWRPFETRIVRAADNGAPFTITEKGAAKGGGKTVDLYAFEDFILAIPEEIPGAAPKR